MKNLSSKIAVIGTSGVGQVHIREILKHKITHLFLVGKKYNSQRASNLNIQIKKKIRITNCKNINELKFLKFNLISICSPMHLHYKHIKFCKNLSKFILVEKPFIWFKKKIKNINLLVTKILKGKGVILVNYPMISLASIIKRKLKLKEKIKTLNFKYHTKGNHKYSDIAADLLPHALSFYATIANREIKNCKIIKINKSKFYWNCKIYLDDVYCCFDFKQNSNKNESQLSFKINDIKFKREQIKILNNFETYLFIDNKNKIKIANPMSHYLNKIFRESNNKRFIEKNNKMIEQTVCFSNFLINKQ